MQTVGKRVAELKDQAAACQAEAVLAAKLVRAVYMHMCACICVRVWCTMAAVMGAGGASAGAVRAQPGRHIAVAKGCGGVLAEGTAVRHTARVTGAGPRDGAGDSDAQKHADHCDGAANCAPGHIRSHCISVNARLTTAALVVLVGLVLAKALLQLLLW